jgi:phospholipid transport system transporter-binding protein
MPPRKRLEALMMLSLPATLTHDHALQTARGLKAQVASQVAGVVIDASALTQFDSSALAVLLACRRQALAAGKTFAVQGLPVKLAQLAGLYGVAELIPSAA